MNTSFNYSGFIEMFLETGDEFEPYGFTDDLPPSADIRLNQHEPSPHPAKINIDPNED